MLDIKLIRSNPEMIRALVAKRGAKADVDAILAADAQVRSLTQQVETLRAERKQLSGKDVREQAIALREKIQDMEKALDEVTRTRDEALTWLPNLLADDTPDGDDDKGNVEIARWGTIPEFDFEPKTHEVLGNRLGILDSERGAKVAGAGFSYWVGDGARLAQGLFALALDILNKHGFTQMFTPIVARERTLFGTGYLPFFGDQIYRLEGEDLALIGTSEQTLVAYHADEILPAERLPLRYCAFSPCFRTEAGAAGRETRGAFRQHQFHKVEQIVLCRPEDSDAWLEKCRAFEEEIMHRLELPYRVVRVCLGDMGAPGYKKYDIEAWFAGYKGWRETHSNTNILDYQTRRLNIRAKDAAKDGAGTFIPHVISATMITDRALLAVLENNQDADGSIRIPEALRSAIGGRDRLAPG
jgi:seryl-tRNA synthetase